MHGKDGATRSYHVKLARQILNRYGIDNSDIFENGKASCKLTEIDQHEEELLYQCLDRSTEDKTEQSRARWYILFKHKKEVFGQFGIEQ